MPWGKFHDALVMRKESPVPGDTHVSAAGGGKKKPKPAPPATTDEDAPTAAAGAAGGHLPVTNMTLAAQQITGQQKPGMGKFAQVLKVDESFGLVLGWAMVCKQGGEDYFDLQDDHIPESTMMASTIDFMQGARAAKEMHAGEPAGVILFAFPLTTEIAKAFGVETKKTGLMIAMKPDSEATLGKFRDGTYTGFSIGGWRLEDEEIL